MAQNAARAKGKKKDNRGDWEEDVLNLMEAESINRGPMGLEAESRENMIMSPRGGGPPSLGPLLAPTEAEEVLNLMEAESTNKGPMGLEAESREKMTMSPRGGGPRPSETTTGTNGGRRSMKLDGSRVN